MNTDDKTKMAIEFKKKVCILELHVQEGINFECK